MSFKFLILIVACVGYIDADHRARRRSVSDKVDSNRDDMELFEIDFSQHDMELDKIDFSRLNGMQWYGVAESESETRILPEDVSCNVLVGFVTNDSDVTTMSRQYVTKAETGYCIQLRTTRSHRLSSWFIKFDEEDEDTLKTFGFRSQCEVERLPESDIRRLFLQTPHVYITDYQDYLVQIACHSFPDSCVVWYFTPQTNPLASQLLKAKDKVRSLSIKPDYVGTECLDLDTMHYGLDSTECLG